MVERATGAGRLTRRAFLAGCLGSPTGARRQRRAARWPWFPDPSREWRGDSSVAAAPPRPERSAHAALGEPGRATLGQIGSGLAARFPQLRRHFVFEYYPWYGRRPFRHWNHWDRMPPDDIAATSMPALGPYDSRATAVLERHAEWIAEAGVGAINLSWWGPGSYSDRAVSRVMDVMRAHDVHVTFHLEPYRADRARHYERDIAYLLREYGDRRRWDAFLLLANADGRVGPVFKSFRTILRPEVVDCHGAVHAVPDYTADADWRRHTDGVRERLRREFDHITLLADSLDPTRMRASGFDGMAIYDNFVEPPSWARHAAAASQQDLVFSFNTNPGYDEVVRRRVEPGSCYRPRRFVPEVGPLDWRRPGDRARAQRAAVHRIEESLETTLRLQSDPTLANARHGFLLVYVNSFNEWHEGHQFEPMRPAGGLSRRQRAVGYHNPEEGSYRLSALGRLLDTVSSSAEL